MRKRAIQVEEIILILFAAIISASGGLKSANGERFSSCIPISANCIPTSVNGGNKMSELTIGDMIPLGFHTKAITFP